MVPVNFIEIGNPSEASFDYLFFNQVGYERQLNHFKSPR
jgi:hypothetical protein